LGLRASQIY